MGQETRTTQWTPSADTLVNHITKFIGAQTGGIFLHWGEGAITLIDPDGHAYDATLTRRPATPRH
jgi:hypothetical protein